MKLSQKEVYLVPVHLKMYIYVTMINIYIAKAFLHATVEWDLLKI